MKRKLSALFSVFLCFAMCLSTLGFAADTPTSEPSPEPSDGTETTETVQEGPEEVIYGRLDNYGRARSAYAVVTLTVDEPGTVTHYGSYTAVENLTDTSPINYSNGVVTLEAEDSGRYYYQGTLRRALMPWDIEISYKLDGEEIDPDDLSGASGELEVDIHTATNSGFDTYFTDNYMLQISVTLDSSLCEDISARNGTVANAGSDKQITFVVLPGGEGDVGFSATVHDFSMAGFTIAGVPYSVSGMMGDTEELDTITDGLDQLSGAVSQLASGADALAEGAGALGDNSATLTEASDQIASALNEISSGLQGFDIDSMMPDMSMFDQLTSGLTQIAVQMENMANMIENMAGGSTVDTSGLMTAMAQLGMAIDKDDTDAQEAYNNLYQQMLALKEQMGGGSTSGLDMLVSGLRQLVDAQMLIVNQVASATSGGIDIDTSAITELQNGMAQLASSYADFNEGLKAYTDGVNQISEGMDTYSSGVWALNSQTSQIPEIMDAFLGTGESEEEEETGPVSFLDERNEDTASVQFVLSTEGITAPEEAAEPQSQEESQGFFADLWDKIVALFT
ncbi:MAG TPA: hypothetical protein IAB47_03825 [Candidatus Scatomorpha merdigallinarum]|nr:hypothetical protein [Candidatus Scatomorpha merdigallinarum]